MSDSWTEHYARFERPVPTWYTDAKLGIFIHWGAYSVPAWAEPIGPLGAFDDEHWFAHNPYAEWYANTIRLDGPAAAHHRETYGDLHYDGFLDLWHAERFDADDLLDLIASTGAGYVVPTTKHHDGIALWDAPRTGDRNTVRRGPRRDLIDEIATAARAHGVRFGVYYSGGLDWHAADAPPITSDVHAGRPVDRAYADLAFDHVADLIERYRPDVLWNDIEWPDAGKHPGPKGLPELFDRFYAAAPDGVVNDRWGTTHRDVRTSEYEAGRDHETGAWENTRGIGFSFGFNRLEADAEYLDGPALVRHFVDVVSRGGNLLLNIGPEADGTVPAPQRRALEALAAFRDAHGDAVFGSRPVPPELASPSDDPWVRWTATADALHAFVDADAGELPLEVDGRVVERPEPSGPPVDGLRRFTIDRR